MADEGSVLGSPAYLQSAGSLGIQQQEQDRAKQGQVQDQLKQGTSELSGVGKDILTQQASKITIDKQMAEALGDPALEGLKMDPKMSIALAKYNGMKEYHEHLLANKVITVEQQGENAAKVATIHAGSSTASATIGAEAKKTAAATEAKGRVDAARIEAAARRGTGNTGNTSPNKPPTDKDIQTTGKNLLKEIDDAAKSDDDKAKDTAIANYNAYAKQNNLAPYSNSPGFLASAAKAIGNLVKGGEEEAPAKTGKPQGDDAARQTAIKTLTDAKKPVTEKNIQYIIDQSSGASQ